MNRDSESIRNGYSRFLYREVLEENLPSICMDLTRIFMYDNALIHIAHIIRDWLWENGIETTI